MELLKQRILRDGRALNENVLLVDSFLNHQVDVHLMKACGEEFARRFADAAIDRVATIESSGIAPAAMTALAMNLPMVIMKKSVSSILKDNIIQTEVFSFTKNAPYLLTLKTDFFRITNGRSIASAVMAAGAMPEDSMVATRFAPASAKRRANSSPQAFISFTST